MARGRWLKKMANAVKDKAEDLKDKVMDQKDDIIGNVTNSITSELGGIDLGPAFKTIQEKGTECQQVARETMELCETTKEKGDAMVAFGSEIQSTLQTFSSGVDASALETIKDLTDGDKLKAAMEIAQSMDEIALKCIDKSVKMIDIMEDAIDDLPDPLEKMIEQAAEKQGKEEDDIALSLEDLDKDIEDVKSCIDAMQHFNIATAFKIGLQAFEQLSAKAKKSRSMFESIKGFSKDVDEITEDFKTLDVVSLSSKIKGILRCISLSEVMRKFAEATKKIIQVIIELFKAMSDRISTLWAALAFAKDCMADCVEHVVQAKSLCLDARDKSKSLIDKSLSVMNQLESMEKVNAKTIGTMRELSQGNEIQDAIELARGMDDLVLQCSEKVTSMVDRVAEGFNNLPDIITEGFDMTQSGKKESDPEPVDVEIDIKELEESRDAIENADIFKACTSGVHGFKSVSGKSSICKDMLELVEGFASDCDGTIESFMSVWDLESAMNKIKEMCRLVSLGELMKQFASQIKRLALAIIALMQSSIEKFSSLDIKDLGFDDLASIVPVEKITENVENIKQKVDEVMGGEMGAQVEDAMEDAMDNVKDKFNKFWK
jgi:hypothetical protein